MTAIKTAMTSFTTGAVASHDGAIIGYRQLGQGPGLVILHGSLSTGYYHLQLAELLADTFTVYLPDRRGFGLSGPGGKGDGIEQDVADVAALLTHTGARYLFGVSLGGVISLKAALTLDMLQKVAVYEPPLFAESATPRAFMERYTREMARGDIAAALTTVMKAAPLISDGFSAMPRWLLTPMTKRMMAFQVNSNYPSFRALAPTLAHDGQVIVQMSGEQARLRDIHAKVLLLGGSKSTTFLKRSLAGVAAAMPQARRIELPGINHGSAWNTEVRGAPAPIAMTLRAFFA
jgi:pimeloyl-ACP methyl ester carboxylesterase